VAPVEIAIESSCIVPNRALQLSLSVRQPPILQTSRPCDVASDQHAQPACRTASRDTRVRTRAATVVAGERNGLSGAKPDSGSRGFAAPDSARATVRDIAGADHADSHRRRHPSRRGARLCAPRGVGSQLDHSGTRAHGCTGDRVSPGSATANPPVAVCDPLAGCRPNAEPVKGSIDDARSRASLYGSLQLNSGR